MNYQQKELNGIKYLILRDKIWVNLQGFMLHLQEMNNEDYLKTISNFLKIPIDELKKSDQFMGATYFNKISK